jgi:lantibiotic modifying enzyme
MPRGGEAVGYNPALYERAAAPDDAGGERKRVRYTFAMTESRISAPPPWSPLLPPADAERAVKVAEEIAADVQSRLATASLEIGPGFPAGAAGLALFFSYLDKARPGKGYDDLAMELLEQGITEMADKSMSPTLYGGFSGVAWVVEHLRGRLFEDEDGEDAVEEVFKALVKLVGLTPWRAQYDLISGLVGYGVFALERLPRAGGEECLRRVVARLSELAEHGSQGTTWLTGPDLMRPEDIEMYPTGNYNLGVAHGVPGVIALLGLAQAAGVECRALLDGTVAWLLAQKLPPGSEAVYTYNVSPGITPPARLAWCYGDLGIAASLLVAARAVGERSWEAEAVAIARRAAERTNMKEAGMVDAGICHGAAGVGHLFNRLHQATGDPVLGEAARHWIQQALALRRDVGIGGYQMWVPNDEQELAWQDEPGFLTGATGVGLALLAAATAVEPDWDRVLQVSPV